MSQKVKNMKVHYLIIRKSATQYIPCGIKRTENWTLNKAEVTCKKCIKKL